MDGIRAGEYRSYYEKYYENRDSSLDAVAQSGRKSSADLRRDVLLAVDHETFRSVLHRSSPSSARTLAAVSGQMSVKILLIGKNGQVGTELATFLPRLGEVVALNRQQLDLAKPSQIRHTIEDVRPHPSSTQRPIRLSTKPNPTLARRRPSMRMPPR